MNTLMSMKKLPRGAWSWAMVDWANSAFILSVVTVFYGPFFQNYWFTGSAEAALFWQSVSVAVSSGVIFLTAPFLGALAPTAGLRRRYLGLFTGLGVISTLLLAVVPEGGWVFAFVLRVTASVGFFGSLIYYDALLPDVSTASNRHIVSGLGYSIGYLGSVLLLLIQFHAVENPDFYGLSGPAAAIKLAFLSVALWWGFFTVPVLLSRPEPDNNPSAAKTTFTGAFRDSLRQLRVTWKVLLAHPPIIWFLLAYFFYIDGVNTLIQMAGGFAAAVGIAEGHLIGSIILVQIVGVPCALLLGWLGQRFGPKPFIYLSIVIYMGVTAYAWRLSDNSFSLFGVDVHEIYLLGLLIGLVQGGLQALSRSYFVSLIPDEHTSGLFGFYNMLGKSSAMMGPLLMGGAALLADDVRTGALAVSVLFLIGLVLLLKAPAEGEGAGPTSLARSE